MHTVFKFIATGQVPKAFTYETLMFHSESRGGFGARDASHEESPLAQECSEDAFPVGLVLGAYIVANEAKSAFTSVLTPTAEKYNRYIDGKLGDMLKVSGPAPDRNETRLFYGLDPKFPVIGLVGLGSECMGYNEEEQRDENKERIREAAGAASRLIQKSAKVDRIYVESFGHAESSAEGAAMSLWSYQEHKELSKRDYIPKLHLFDDCDTTGWQIGLHKAAAQNLARQLCEAPPNLLTPRSFAEHAVKLLNTSGINIEMKISSWLKMVGMESLLALGRGSCQDPLLVEAAYYGCDPEVCPVVLIGKGMTFDSGGLCLKSKEDMEFMKADMSGAAVVIAALRAASALQLPINIRALLPMCENMIGPKAMRPGDVIKTLRGHTIKVNSTDTEGRLSMVDMLTYAATYRPKFILDIGTMSKGVKQALGPAATGVWTNNDMLWEQMRVAGVHTGDRVWRFPIWKHFKRRIKFSQTSDFIDADTAIGGPNITAAFFNEFICQGDWIHMDNYGVTRTTGEQSPYLRKGMTGRPTRTLIEFLAQFACLSPEKRDAERRLKQKNKFPRLELSKKATNESAPCMQTPTF